MHDYSDLSSQETNEQSPTTTEKHLKNCSVFLGVSDMQIKSTLKLQLTPVSMAKINNTDDRACWYGFGSN